MATKKQCRECRKRSGCPIIVAIKSEHIKAGEILRKLCKSFKEK